MIENNLLGTKIIVLGCSGSGKSFFAGKLREKTGLPLIHLDNIWWKPDRTHISREEFDLRLAALLRGDRWILDGDYSRTYEPRIRACDTVIFLDYGEAAAMEGITSRVGRQRPDIPWTESSLDPELVDLVKNYQTKNRPVLLALLEKYPEKRRIILCSREEADAWLAMRIRQATAEEMLGLWGYEDADHAPPTAQYFYEQISCQNVVFWALDYEGDIIGELYAFLDIEEDKDFADGHTTAYLCAFRIKPEFRGRGLGSGLMEAALADLKARGFHRATIGVDEARNERLYRRLGFETEVRKCFFDPCARDENMEPEPDGAGYLLLAKEL